MLGYFPHGIWFVELAPLTDPELIPQTVLSTIGIHEQAGRPSLELLKEYLREKMSLIILDNCEHLIDASARLIILAEYEFELIMDTSSPQWIGPCPIVVLTVQRS